VAAALTATGRAGSISRVSLSRRPVRPCGQADAVLRTTSERLRALRARLEIQSRN
jgi:hypothetical protein